MHVDYRYCSLGSRKFTTSCNLLVASNGSSYRVNIAVKLSVILCTFIALCQLISSIKLCFAVSLHVSILQRKVVSYVLCFYLYVYSRVYLKV